MGYKWNSFSVIDEKQIGDGNINVGDSFVYGGAHAEMYVYDNDRGLAGDRGRNERGSDYQPGWVYEDGEWTQAGNVYWEGYFTMRGSDGRTYYMIEIEGTCLDDRQDYFAFYGAVPPQGVTLTAQCYYGDCGSLSYACLDGGEIGSTPVAPEAANDFLAVQQGEGADGADINILLNDEANTGEALVVKEVDGSASVVGVWVDLDNGGKILIAADGTVDFDADGDFDALGAGETATVTIDYTVINSDGLEDTATLTIEVTGVNDAPVAVDQAVRTDEDTPVSGNVMTGAFDVDGDAVSLDGISIGAIGEAIEVTTAGGYTGTIVVNADGTFTFTPGPDADDMETGEIDTFTFEFTVKSQNGMKEVGTTRTIDFETAAGTATQSGGPGNPGNDKAVGGAGENPNGTGQAGNPGSKGNSDGFAIDPTTTTGGGALNAGDVITTQIEGVTISVCANGKGKKYNEAMIFDSNNPTGGDNDLKTDSQNNILIISEDGHSHDPDDNAKGGQIRFTFDEPTDVKSLTLIDNEEGVWIGFYDADWNQTGSQWVGGGADNSVDVVALDGQDVTHMLVVLKGSGAVDDLVISDTYEVPDYLYDTATVTVTIEGQSDNTPPTVEAQTATTDENTTVFGDLLDGAMDAENDDLTIVSTDFGVPGSYSVTTDGGRTGTLVVTEDGMFSFTPDGIDLDLNQSDTITFGFTATDGEFEASSTATITITGLNAAPTVESVALSTNEANDQGLSSSVSGDLMTGAADADGDLVFLQSVSLGEIGQTVSVITDGGNSGDLTINADGTFTFVSTSSNLDAGETDTLTIDFTAVSSGGVTEQTAAATATITINGVNVAPVSVSQSYIINEQNDYGLAPTAATGSLLDDATDADGDAVSLASVTVDGMAVTLGEATMLTTAGGRDVELLVNADGTFTLTSTDDSMDAGETDSFTFEFTLQSSGGTTVQTSNVSTVTVGINGVNVAPVAGDVSASTNEANAYGLDNSVSGNLLDASVDTDGDELTVQSFTVNGIAGVLGAEMEVDTAGGGTGVLTVAADGSYTFVSTSDGLDVGQNDSLEFGFTVASSGGVLTRTDDATATIAINGLNAAPVAINQSYEIDESQSVFSNLLSGSSDPDGDSVKFVGATDANKGALTVTTFFPISNNVKTDGGLDATVILYGNGNIRFTPSPALQAALDAGETDTYTFTYQVSSNGGATTQVTTASATIVINGLTPNRAPVAELQTLVISETEVANGDLNEVTSDPDGDTVLFETVNGQQIEETLTLNVTSDTNGWSGSLVVNEDGTYTFDPSDSFLALDEGESETVTFTYTVSDGALTATNEVEITVTGEADDTGGPGGDPEDGNDVNVIYLFNASASMFSTTYDCDGDGNGDTSYIDVVLREAGELHADMVDVFEGRRDGTTIDDDYYAYGSAAFELSDANDIGQLAGNDLAAALGTLNLDTSKETRIYIFTDDVEDAAAAEAAANSIIAQYEAAGTLLTIDGVAIGLQGSSQLNDTVRALEGIDTDEFELLPGGGGLGGSVELGGLGGLGGIGATVEITSPTVDIIADCEDDFSGPEGTALRDEFPLIS